MRRSLAALAIVLGAVAPATVATGIACADEGDRAVLVVDTGESELSYCVRLPDDSVSGLDLIELAGEQHGLQYRFGHGGQAVCELAGVGPDGEDCFGDYPDFWGYWRGDGSGGWTWSSTGGGSTVVSDGDVEGWSWGRGQDGSSHPPPPPTTFGDVCPAPAKSEAKPRADDARPQVDRRQPTRGSPAVAAAPASPGLEREPPDPQPRHKKDQRKEASSRQPLPQKTTPPAGADLASDTEDASPSGPPIAGIAGVLIAVALACVFGARSRKRTD